MGQGNENQKHNTPEYEKGYEDAFGFDCPNCDNGGVINLYVGGDVKWEDQQCQWCHVEPNSKFNRRKQLELDV